MAGIDEQSKIKNEGEIRYLSPLDINTSRICLLLFQLALQKEQGLK